MINSGDVYEAVRRGYNELELASNSEISDYFSEIDPGSIGGHVSHIKGILFEQEYVEQLATQGIHAQIFEATNHPATDIAIFDDGGDVINELQLKATESASYIHSTLEEYPDIEIVATTEVASELGSDMVIDSGIEEAVLEEAVLDVVNPVSPISIIGWFFGIF